MNNKATKINWANFHTHSLYCDGVGELEVYVKKAIEKKMFAIGFSSHAPVPFPSGGHMESSKLDNYINEIENLKRKYSNKINIYSGLEVEYIPNIIGPNSFRKKNLDIIIGSVHYVNQYDDGENYLFDITVEEFKKGFELIFNNNIKKLVKGYYGNVISMVENDPPDVIGHLDLIKKFNNNNRYFNENDDWYKYILLDVIKVISKSNCIVEINTRGYYKGITKEFYPGQWIVEKCLEHSIPIAISADAHNAEDVNNSFEEAASFLLDIGYKNVQIFNEGKWQKVGLSKNGFEIYNEIENG